MSAKSHMLTIDCAIHNTNKTMVLFVLDNIKDITKITIKILNNIMDNFEKT